MIFKKEQYLVFLLLVGLIIFNIPLVFDTPVGQTDQAHFYSLAKAIREEGCIDCLAPAYANFDLGEIVSIADYPALFTSFFAVLSGFFNDILLLNGLFMSIFYVLFLIYTYKFTKLLMKDNTLSLLVTVFMAFNLRFFYMAIVGIWPFLISACLAMPSLYYFLLYVTNNRRNYAFWCVIFTILSIHAHQMMSIFLLILMIMLYLGYSVEQRMFLQFPRISLKTVKKKCRLKPLLVIFIPITVFFLLNAFLFTLTEGRVSWLSGWIEHLLEDRQGIIMAWYYLFLFDGPLVFIFGLLGGVYFFFTNKWKMFFLWLGGVGLVLLPLLMLGQTKIASYPQKFYVFFFFILVLGFLCMINELRWRKLFWVIIVISLLIQIGKVLFFLSMVQPAITPEELALAQSLQPDDHILYVNKWTTGGTFKEFKWMPVFAGSRNFDIIREGYYNESLYDVVVILEDGGFKVKRSIPLLP